MTLKVTALASLLALGLTACGGGGGGDSSATSTTSTSFDTSPFVGTWNPVDTSCHQGWVYNSALYVQSGTTVISDTTASSTTYAYTDAACTAKAGKLVENYSLSLSQGSSTGWTTVARALMTFTGSSSGADGGSGMTLTKIPDGSSTNGGKYLLAVSNNQLYTSASVTSTLDANGYPTVISTTAFGKK